MDEYIEILTLAISGRVPPIKCEMRLNPEFMLAHKFSESAIDFLRACNNAEFREYYFRPNFVSLKYLENIKEVIFMCNPEVFEYTIRTFRDQYKNLEISCHYADVNEPVLEFKYVRDIKTNPLRYTTRTYFADNYLQIYNVENRDVMEMLRERGFTVYNSGMESYATLTMLNLNRNIFFAVWG